ncbi:hypothetical protein CTA1_11913 [Colletotrichum tanaceti]|uniref:Uncharacterized protein n=1 Tax=Colletotrichum tanaceti TaxID=1306861 RepID=A0A4U6XL08_9PEZI|nr:hypothetical protein CTA1_11913 [Colletotrichum tanaceti]
MATSTAQAGVRFRSYPPTRKHPGVANDTAADELAPDTVLLSSHRIPTLAVGTYAANIDQTITAPDGKTDKLSTQQQFAVEAPQLRLDPNVDVHSVFPAPGHGAPANTLPHIVFNDAELPWERSVSASHTSPDSFNRVPWTALLTFTQEELYVPPEHLAGWQQADKPRQGPTLAVSMAAGHLRQQREPPPVFDWTNRTLILAEFARQCVDSLKQPGCFEWDTAQGIMPSSVLASQLASAAFQLTIDSPPDDELQKVLADPNRTPWLTKDGARQIYVTPAVSAPASATITAKTSTASVDSPLITTATILQHVELPVDHRPPTRRPPPPVASTTGATAPPTTTRTVKDLPRFDYGPYYYRDERFFSYGATQNKYADYFRPTIDCFPLHLGRGGDRVLLQPYRDAPMDVVFTATGRTETNFMPFNVDLIEWLIPVHVAAAAAEESSPLLDESLTPEPGDLPPPPLFAVGGTLDHPDLPAVEPINIGCRWLYDARLTHGTLLDYPEERYEHNAVPKPDHDARNLGALLVVRARARDNPWREDRHVKKLVDASFLLKGARWHMPDAVRLLPTLGEDGTVGHDMKFGVCFRNIHRSPVSKSIGLDRVIRIEAKQ